MRNGEIRGRAAENNSSRNSGKEQRAGAVVPGPVPSSPPWEEPVSSSTTNIYENLVMKEGGYARRIARPRITWAFLYPLHVFLRYVKRSVIPLPTSHSVRGPARVRALSLSLITLDLSQYKRLHSPLLYGEPASKKRRFVQLPGSPLCIPDRPRSIQLLGYYCCRIVCNIIRTYGRYYSCIVASYMIVIALLIARVAPRPLKHPILVTLPVRAAGRREESARTKSPRFSAR